MVLTLYRLPPLLFVVTNWMDAFVPSSTTRSDGSTNFGKQRFPAPVSLMGCEKRVMLKLVVFTPSPMLMNIKAALS